MMVVVALLAIATVIGLPAFGGMFDQSRADADISELLRAMNLARMEAINHSEDVTVRTVSNGNWAEDLLVERDNHVVRRYAGFVSGANLTAGESIDQVVFNSLGGLKIPSNAVVFSYRRGDSVKNLVVCPTGRVLTGVSCI